MLNALKGFYKIICIWFSVSFSIYTCVRRSLIYIYVHIYIYSKPFHAACFAVIVIFVFDFKQTRIRIAFVRLRTPHMWKITFAIELWDRRTRSFLRISISKYKQTNKREHIYTHAYAYACLKRFEKKKTEHFQPRSL